MNDTERLAALQTRLKDLEGLNKETFDRVSAALDQRRDRLGYDAQGRLKLAFFDAKSYDQHCGHDATKPW